MIDPGERVVSPPDPEELPQMDTLTLTALPTLNLPEGFRDASGFPVFSDGDEGQAHAAAHWFADRGLHAEGHAYLKDWLRRNPGSGPRFVHLQWHLAVFEIETDRLDDALDRYLTHILPAVPQGEALTDAPELLWRLSLRTGLHDELPWEDVHAAALDALETDPDWHVQLHAVLALAGAGDLDALDALIAHTAGGDFEAELVVLVAMGLRALVTQNPHRAVSALRAAVPALGHTAGSQAQGGLFHQLLAVAETEASQGRRQLVA